MLDGSKRLEAALVSSREKTQRWVFYSGIRTFHPILHGKFTLITDQKRLVKTPEARRDRAASSWQVLGVESRGRIPLPWHQVGCKHPGADTFSWVPLQADSAPQSPLTHCISPRRKVLFLLKKLQRVKLTDFCIFFLGEICTGGMESGWRTVSPRGKHFWCLVSNLLEKNRCQCQLQSVSIQKLASAPVPARDRKLRPRGVHRGLSMEFWISPF